MYADAGAPGLFGDAFAAELGSIGRSRLALEFPNRSFRMRPVMVPDFAELGSGCAATRCVDDADPLERAGFMLRVLVLTAMPSAGAELLA